MAAPQGILCAKVAYPSAAEARDAAAALRRRSGMPNYVYRCPYCGELHLTREKQKRKL